jgi:hypothetical protein
MALNLVSQKRRTCWGKSSSEATSLMVLKAPADFVADFEDDAID